MALREESRPFHSARIVTTTGVARITMEEKANPLSRIPGSGKTTWAPRALKKTATKKVLSERRALRTSPLTGNPDRAKPAAKPRVASGGKFRGSGLAPWTPEWRAWCAEHFPNSFDPKTGTIVPYDGTRTLCR